MHHSFIEENQQIKRCSDLEQSLKGHLYILCKAKGPRQSLEAPLFLYFPALNLHLKDTQIAYDLLNNFELAPLRTLKNHKMKTAT